MELFAADGHDAGGCERVTGKSGMRPGLWQCRQQAHFDGERCELSVWVFPAMKARLRQRAQRDGIALSELVRRFCDQGLRA